MPTLDTVRDRQFDIAIIGGGIIGAGCARDAALRGLSVALFEKGDYGGATTAGSTRLIHGGLRYLEMFDFGLVRMDLRERETLLRIAPHLVKPLEFLIPFYDRGIFHRWKMRAGMVLYDLLSYDKSLPKYRTLNAAEVHEAEPALRRGGLQGGVSYYDAQVLSPERLAVENIVDARRRTAETFNYVEVIGGLSDSRAVTGVRVRDLESGYEADVRARVVVNASGPWFNRVSEVMPAAPQGAIRTTKGAHYACPQLTQRAVVLFSKYDGRLFFVIPLGSLGWVSTTDTDYTGDPAAVRASAEDLKYLIESTTEFIPQAHESTIYWTNAGVRALVMQRGRESDVSRSHRIEQAPGLVSILGGKITGFRAIAEEAIDVAAAQLGSAAKCTTAERNLPGAERAGQPFDLAIAVHRAVDEEQCRHLSDFIFRRLTLGLEADQGMSQCDLIAGLMAEQLGWTAAHTGTERLAYQTQVLGTREAVRNLESSPWNRR